jgi:spore germination protein YaaH
MNVRARIRRAAGSALLGASALVLVAAASTAAPVAAVPAAAAKPHVKPYVSGWMPYWATATSLAQVRAHPGLFTELSPFWYALKNDAAGTGTTVLSHPLDTGTYASVVAALHAQHIAVVPTITDQTGSHRLAALLNGRRTRAAVVATLTRRAVLDGVDGLDLDFEGFAFHDGRSTWSALRPTWVAFVHELHDSLARVHKVLDVTVPPMDSTANSYWVYDPVHIAPYVHALRLMAYDYHVDKAGPIAPLPWVNDVIETATAGVPAAKVFLGVPAYGRSWVTRKVGTCPTGVDLTKSVVTPDEAVALAASSKVGPTWDATASERTFSYSRTYKGSTSGASPAATSCTVTRTIWYDDGAAIAARAKAAAAAHLGGIAVWSIDDIPSTTWAAVAPALVAPKAPAARAASASPAPSAASPVAVADRVEAFVTPGLPSSDPPSSTSAPEATVVEEALPTSLVAATGRGSLLPATVSGLLAALLLVGGVALLRGRAAPPAPASAGRHARPPAHAAPRRSRSQRATGVRRAAPGGGAHAAPEPSVAPQTPPPA